jgi:DNA-directed RNA polymerase subunit RPC12/RpoP
MTEDKDKPRETIFRRLANKKRSEQTNDGKQSVELKPALPELGTTPCPICRRRVTVFVTRTKRPFINCGYCSARIFYNGSRSMQLLQKQIKPAKRMAS